MPLPPKRRQAPKPSCRSYGSPADWSKVWHDFALILLTGLCLRLRAWRPVLSHLVVSLGKASERVDRHRAVASRPAVDGARSRVANCEPPTGTGPRMEFSSLLVELFVRCRIGRENI